MSYFPGCIYVALTKKEKEKLKNYSETGKFLFEIYGPYFLKASDPY